jgi:hypothetical protein
LVQTLVQLTQETEILCFRGLMGVLCVVMGVMGLLARAWIGERGSSSVMANKSSNNLSMSLKGSNKGSNNPKGLGALGKLKPENSPNHKTGSNVKSRIGSTPNFLGLVLPTAVSRSVSSPLVTSLVGAGPQLDVERGSGGITTQREGGASEAVHDDAPWWPVRKLT